MAGMFISMLLTSTQAQGRISARVLKDSNVQLNTFHEYTSRILYQHLMSRAVECSCVLDSVQDPVSASHVSCGPVQQIASHKLASKNPCQQVSCLIMFLSPSCRGRTVSSNAQEGGTGFSSFHRVALRIGHPSQFQSRCTCRCCAHSWGQ